MKKLFLWFAALLLGALVLVLATDWALPDPARAAVMEAGDGGVVYAAENGPISASVYGVDSGGNLLFFHRESHWGGQRAVAQLAWGKGQLSVLWARAVTGGVHWEVTALDDEARSTAVGAITAQGYRATGLTAPAYIAAVVEDGSGAAVVFDATTGAELLRRSAPAEGRMLSARYLPEEEALLAVLDGDGSTAKVGRTGVFPTPAVQRPSLPQKITVPLALRVLCKAPLLLFTAAAVLMLELLVLLAVLFFLRGRRLAVRTAAMSTLGLLVGLALMSGLLVCQSTAQRLEERLDQRRDAVRQLAATLSVQDPAAMLRADFYASEEQGRYAALLSAQGRIHLLALRDGVLSVAVSGHLPYATAAELAFSPETALIAQAAAGGQSSGTLVGRTMVCAAPLYSSGVPVGVVLAETDAGDIPAAALQTLMRLALLGVMAAAAACALLTILLRRMTRPIGQLTSQMKAVSDGNLRVQSISSGLDELSEMAGAMQEMCMNLSIRDYEVQSTVESYGRFVPRGLCQLLDRASVTEVSFGDVCTLSGNITLLSVNNRETARHALEDAPFMAFVNRVFFAVEQAAANHGGHLLSSGADLAALKLYFPGRAASTVCSGLELLGALQTEGNGGISPDLFLLFHRTEFLYGLAGTGDTVFPFLASQEMELLGAYAPRFAATGTRVVMTNSFLKELEPGYVTRYIGFISAPDTGTSYKLYELLDSYPELERNLRIRYDARFQEAIQLFYKSDYYLARNLFSSLLRACPTDGIVRWYLFACEHYFNAGPQSEPDCQLFSIDE